jgi:hypothetical protein
MRPQSVGRGRLAGAAMTGEDGRQVFEAILPHQALERLGAECGGIERPRKRHLGMVVRARVIAAGTPGGAYQGRRAAVVCGV